jgi:hypothetical protein
LRKLHAKPLAEGGEISVVEHRVGLRRVRRLLKNEASSKNCSKTIDAVGEDDNAGPTPAPAPRELRRLGRRLGGLGHERGNGRADLGIWLARVLICT